MMSFFSLFHSHLNEELQNIDFDSDEGKLCVVFEHFSYIWIL